MKATQILLALARIGSWNPHSAQSQAAPLPQAPGPVSLTESGQVLVAGRSTPYLIHHLPISSFPELPAPIMGLLNRRGCTIPQTYAAHHPENVVHASLERAGSSDWAVLCSVGGTVSLLIFFDEGTTEGPTQADKQPVVLTSTPGSLSSSSLANLCISVVLENDCTSCWMIPRSPPCVDTVFATSEEWL